MMEEQELQVAPDLEEVVEAVVVPVKLVSLVLQQLLVVVEMDFKSLLLDHLLDLEMLVLQILVILRVIHGLLVVAVVQDMDQDILQVLVDLVVKVVVV
tara:strand:+ start:199 stop:492 length:294 start_codon:yes stop_codon:yes gene_type:complete